MDRVKILEKITQHMKTKLSDEGSGHDWWHIQRVLHTANYIAEKEGADMFIVELAVLLHEVGDYKIEEFKHVEKEEYVRDLLQSTGVDSDAVDHVILIISEHFYKGALGNQHMSTIEGQVVEDADFLDGMGAIGIARTFRYGGKKGVPMHDPNIEFEFHSDEELYRNKPSTSINHFYEKLLLLKEKMNTNTGKKLAEHRHVFLELFLEEFLAEWDGDK